MLIFSLRRLIILHTHFHALFFHFQSIVFVCTSDHQDHGSLAKYNAIHRCTIQCQVRLFRFLFHWVFGVQFLGDLFNSLDEMSEIFEIGFSTGSKFGIFRGFETTHHYLYSCPLTYMHAARNHYHQILGLSIHLFCFCATLNS